MLSEDIAHVRAPRRGAMFVENVITQMITRPVGVARYRTVPPLRGG